MSAPAILHPVDYTSRDYVSLREDLIKVMQSRIPEWQADDPSDFGLALVESMAYMGDVLNYYIDRSAAETFLGTASQRQSILNIASLLGYSPAGRIAARVPLTFTNVSDIPAQIAAGARVTTVVRTGEMNIPISFELDTNPDSGDGSWTIPGEGQSTTIPATEGTTAYRRLLGQSDGTPGQKYTIRDTPMINRSLSVWVGPDPDSATPYSYVQNLYEATEADAMFTYRTDEDGVTEVTFGDGVSGRIPEMSQYIYATYRLGGGVRGNISHGQVFTPVDFAFTGSITNRAQAAGGAEEESSEQIRQSAFTAFRARNRAVTKQDFEDLALNDNRVSKAKARGNSFGNMMVYVAPVSSGDRKTDPMPGFDAYNIIDRSLSGGMASLTLAEAPQFSELSATISGMGSPWDGTHTVSSRASNKVVYPVSHSDLAIESCSGVLTTGELPGFKSTREEIARTLQTKGVIGTVVNVYPPRYHDVRVEIEIGIHPQFRQSSAITSTRSSVLDMLSYNRVPFNMTVRPQEILAHLVATVPEVKYATVALYDAPDAASPTDLVIAASDELIRILDQNLSVTVSEADPGISHA